jgi:hypothetical protein
MRPVDLLAELEQDIEWRERELNALSRMLPVSLRPEDMLIRRSAVALIQAHSEGFTRFSLQAYIRFINAQRVKAEDAIDMLAAQSLTREFRGVREPSADEAFRALGLPTDNKALLRAYVEAKFIAALLGRVGDVVELDPGTLDRFEKNLDEELLQMLLFRLGLDPTPHKPYSSKLNGLVIRRNAIAHGENGHASRSEITVWDQMLRLQFRTVRDAIYTAASQRSFRKVP